MKTRNQSPLAAPELPSTWTHNHAAAVSAIQAYAEGGQIKDHVRRVGLSWGWFWEMVSQDQEVRRLYEKARLARVELMAGEMLAAADNTNLEPAHNRNRMHARQWLMGKWLPAIYGDKVRVEEELGPNLSRILAMGLRRAGLDAPMLDLDAEPHVHTVNDIKRLTLGETDTASVPTLGDNASDAPNTLIPLDFWDID